MIRRYEPASDAFSQWQAPSMVGCVGLGQEQTLIVGLADGIYRMELNSGEFTSLLRPLPVNPDVRFNDGRTDRFGRFLCGSMGIHADPQGALYWVSADGHVGMHQQRCCGAEHHPVTLPAHSLLKAATVDGAACAGLQDKVGSLAPGKQVDLILIHVQDINLYPSGNAFGTVVHAAERSNVETVMNGGCTVKRNGKVLGVDSDRLRTVSDESREHLFAAAGYQPDIFAETFLPLESAR